MYVSPNYKSKKELREALAAGKTVTVFQPNDLRVNPSPENGDVAIEGPHYLAPHTWYATVRVVDGVVKKVLR